MYPVIGNHRWLPVSTLKCDRKMAKHNIYRMAPKLFRKAIFRCVYDDTDIIYKRIERQDIVKVPGGLFFVKYR